MKKDEIVYNKNDYPIWKNTGILCHRERIMKKHNLEKIDKGWVVHHIDGNKENFRKSNLILLRDKDHKDLERYIRKIKNLNIAYFFFVGVSFPFYLISFLGFFGPLMSGVYFTIATLMLFLAFILRIVPSRFLRTGLFKFRLLKKNPTRV